MSRARAKGTRWENEVVDGFRRAGFVHVERRVMGGINDRGDIAGLPDFVIECKDHNRIALSEWVSEAASERENADAAYSVVFAKRRGKARAEDGYVVMDGATFIAIVSELTK